MHISEKFHSIQKQFYIFLGKGIKIEFQNYGKMFKELKNNYKLAQNLNYNFGFRFKFPFKKHQNKIGHGSYSLYIHCIEQRIKKKELFPHFCKYLTTITMSLNYIKKAQTFIFFTHVGHIEFMMFPQKLISVLMDISLTLTLPACFPIVYFGIELRAA